MACGRIGIKNPWWAGADCWPRLVFLLIASFFKLTAKFTGRWLSQITFPTGRAAFGGVVGGLRVTA
jgi:hypothetical protein